jgi:hypothetical protein
MIKKKKKKAKKAFWEEHVGGIGTKPKEKKKKEAPKKVEKVKPKKKPVRKFKTKAKKKVEVQKKTDRSAKEAKGKVLGIDIPLYEHLAKVNKGTEADKKRAISTLMAYGWFGEWLQGYVYNYMERKGTSRGQIPVSPRQLPTELPEFQVLQRSQSSVELKRDAKGKVVFTVKAYADTSFEAAKEAILNFNKVIQSVDVDEDE